MIKLKNLLTEEKEAFQKEKEGKISYRIDDKYISSGRAKIWMYVSDFSNTSGAYTQDQDYEHMMGQIVLLDRVPVEDLDNKIPRRQGYLFVDSIVSNVKSQGYGYLLYKAALKYAQQHKFKGLISTTLHRSNDANKVWEKFKTFSDGNYDYVDIKDLGTRLKETLNS